LSNSEKTKQAPGDSRNKASEYCYTKKGITQHPNGGKKLDSGLLTESGDGNGKNPVGTRGLFPKG